MEHPVILSGEYKGVIILLKKGNALEELPINYEADHSNLFYGIFAAISSALKIGGGFVQAIANKFNAESSINKALAKKKYILGDVIYCPHRDNNFFLLVLDSASQNLEAAEKNLLKATIIKGLDEAESQGLSSVIIPGISCKNNAFPIKVAANIHFEAIEDFIDERELRGKSKNIDLISVCLYQDDEANAFTESAKHKFKKYDCYVSCE